MEKIIHLSTRRAETRPRSASYSVKEKRSEFLSEIIIFNILVDPGKFVNFIGQHIVKFLTDFLIFLECFNLDAKASHLGIYTAWEPFEMKS